MSAAEEERRRRAEKDEAILAAYERQKVDSPHSSQAVYCADFLSS